MEKRSKCNCVKISKKEMAGKKRKRGRERATIHPRNKYSENPPDFGLLASLYPTFQPFVFYSRDGRPRIDWKDYNATRELTRVLLLHDHGLNWCAICLFYFCFFPVLRSQINGVYFGGRKMMFN